VKAGFEDMLSPGQKEDEASLLESEFVNIIGPVE